MATAFKALVGPCIAGMEKAITSYSFIKGIGIAVVCIGFDIYEVSLIVFLKAGRDVIY